MRLSQNFTLRELTKSSTAERRGIPNEPDEDKIDNIIDLCDKILQPVRDKFGPVTVTSGYRCPELCDW